MMKCQNPNVVCSLAHFIGFCSHCLELQLDTNQACQNECCSGLRSIPFLSPFYALFKTVLHSIKTEGFFKCLLGSLSTCKSDRLRKCINSCQNSPRYYQFTHAKHFKDLNLQSYIQQPCNLFQ